ncbi:MAG: hypothetical protein JRG97_01605 [Deltaproteobacteria bacterium]|nr:hypothetical protein [Deltaproteobacteria bacterium]MBW2139751.1 hypothetical protein [Deltaproteobacteria bacterium]MBW2323751.1 hypothetical protein [Deltaproteobacteria bacterium]
MERDIQLAKLVNMESPEEVLKEGLYILKLFSPDYNTEPITLAYNKTVSLYKGRWPEYQSCNTEFHDLRHMTDTFLAMTRLIHGAMVDGEELKELNESRINLALIATMLHDTGYIQQYNEQEGTGAKFTAHHVQRGITFLERHASEYGLSPEEISDGRAMILCTDLAVDISTIEFSSREMELLGKMLGTTDLLAQMADRTYLEKLLFLYHEFKEARVGDYESEIDLLHKTVGFYDFIAHRLEMALDSTDRFMISHFTARWDIKVNLYQEAIEKQKNFLSKILEMPDADPRRFLKRYGIVEKVRQTYRETPE